MGGETICSLNWIVLISLILDKEKGFSTCGAERYASKSSEFNNFGEVKKLVTSALALV